MGVQITDPIPLIAYGEIWVKDNPVETTLNSASKVQYEKFSNNGESLNTAPDFNNSHITIKIAGKYMITASLSIENQAGAKHIIDASVYLNNGTIQILNVHAHRTLSAGTDLGSLSLSGIVALDVGETVELWLDTDRAINSDVILSDCTLSIVKI